MTTLEEKLKAEMGKQKPIEIKEEKGLKPMEQFDPSTGEVISTDLEVSIVQVDGMQDYDFEALEEAEEISLDPVYWSCSNKGESSVGYYYGPIEFHKNRNGEKLTLTGHAWVTKTGLYFVGGATTSDRFKPVPKGAPIKIEYLGKVPTKDGANEYKDYKVSLLKIKK